MNASLISQFWSLEDETWHQADPCGPQHAGGSALGRAWKKSDCAFAVDQRRAADCRDGGGAPRDRHCAGLSAARGGNTRHWRDLLSLLPKAERLDRVNRIFDDFYAQNLNKSGLLPLFHLLINPSDENIKKFWNLYYIIMNITIIFNYEICQVYRRQIKYENP